MRTSLTPDQSKAKAKRAEDARRRRRDESMCAWDFLTWGDNRGEHKDFCMFVIEGYPPCSRTYHTGPPPYDEALYEGTGIGALYGLAGSERHLWQLAGWTLDTTQLTPPKEEE